MIVLMQTLISSQRRNPINASTYYIKDIAGENSLNANSNQLMILHESETRKSKVALTA